MWGHRLRLGSSDTIYLSEGITVAHVQMNSRTRTFLALLDSAELHFLTSLLLTAAEVYADSEDDNVDIITRLLVAIGFPTVRDENEPFSLADVPRVDH